MKRFTTTTTIWGLALAAALAAGCSPNSTADSSSPSHPSEAPRPSESAVEECEHCLSSEKASAAVAANTEGHLRSPWLEPNARGVKNLTNLRVTDQDNHKLNLSELNGQPLVLTFLYTRCTNPNRCPLVATQMSHLQKLVEAEGLDSKVSLAIVTYDPDYDAPEKLQQYGLDRGLRFTPNVRMLRPDREQMDGFLNRLQVTVNYNSEGVNLHGLQLFLFDNKGRFVSRYQSVIWDNAEVLADLKRLAQEDR